jgi:hypothetical protein
LRLSAISDHSMSPAIQLAEILAGAIECRTVHKVEISNNKTFVGRWMLLQIRKQCISEEAFTIGVVGGSVDAYQGEKLSLPQIIYS